FYLLGSTLHFRSFALRRSYICPGHPGSRLFHAAVRGSRRSTNTLARFLLTRYPLLCRPACETSRCVRIFPSTSSPHAALLPHRSDGSARTTCLHPHGTAPRTATAWAGTARGRSAHRGYRTANVQAIRHSSRPGAQRCCQWTAPARRRCVSSKIPTRSAAEFAPADC